MTRKHRIAHRVLWPLLALIVCFGFLSALVLRPPPASDAPQTAQETRK
jgi:hypothetical protein